MKEATKFPRHPNKHSELTVSISFINDLCVNPKPKAVPNPKVQLGLGMSLKSHGPNRKRNYDRGKNKPVISQHLSVSRLLRFVTRGYHIECNLKLHKHADTGQSPG